MQAFSSLPRAVEAKGRSFDFARPLRGNGRAALRMTRVLCWGEVDGVLAELGRLARELEGVEKREAEERARVERETEARRGPLEARREELERVLERFCRGQGELDRVDGHGRKSKRLMFGRVGYRAAQAVTIRDEAAALRALARWRAGRQFLRVRTEVDRESLRQFLLETAGKNGAGARVRRRLQRVGVRIEQREKFFYEINREAVRKWSTQYSVPTYADPPTPTRLRQGFGGFRLRRVQATTGRQSTQRKAR